jgi:hypothetical protein
MANLQLKQIDTTITLSDANMIEITSRIQGECSKECKTPFDKKLTEGLTPLWAQFFEIFHSIKDNPAKTSEDMSSLKHLLSDRPEISRTYFKNGGIILVSKKATQWYLVKHLKEDLDQKIIELEKSDNEFLINMKNIFIQMYESIPEGHELQRVLSEAMEAQKIDKYTGNGNDKSNVKIPAKRQENVNINTSSNFPTPAWNNNNAVNTIQTPIIINQQDVVEDVVEDVVQDVVDTVLQNKENKKEEVSEIKPETVVEYSQEIDQTQPSMMQNTIIPPGQYNNCDTRIPIEYRRHYYGPHGQYFTDVPIFQS